jgi:PAS domain S-box-containing protein
MKILIVDDNPDSRIFLERALRAEGHTVEAASNGLQAFDLITRSRPDMIISDILMPEMDGYELCRRIKSDERYHTIPFIFYSATYTDSEDEKLALSLGASKFIVKPMEIESLLHMIDEVLDDYRKSKLSIPGSAMEPDSELTRKQLYLLARKLDKKVRELEQERRASREKEELINLLLYSTAEAIYSVDRDGNCTFCNPVCVRLLGYSSPDDLKGKNMHSLIHHSRPDGTPLSDADCKIYSVFRNDEETHVDNEVFWRKDGTSFPVEYWSYPVKRDGETAGAIVTFIDISERKKLELQLLQAQKMEAIGQLAGGIAHDFNNILSAIVNYIYLIRKKTEGIPAVDRDLDHISSLAMKASEITRGLLAFSRKSIVTLAPLNLNDSIRNIEKILRKFIGEDIELETSFTEEEPYIMADAVQIEQTLMNLATNARDAMPEGGRLTLTTETVRIDEAAARSYGFDKPGDYALLVVTDTGKGMDQETLQRIFEPFFTTKEIGKGTGLGLSIVYGLIKQHKGYIHAYSEPGKGTTFKIYLPLIRSDRTAKVLPEKIEYLGKGETLLIAEDEDNLRSSMKSILEAAGYRVVEAKDGVDAVERFRQHDGNIVLLIIDIVMPQMSGIEAYNNILKLSPDVRAIFTSGYTGEHVERRGMLPENAVLISKPVLPAEFLRKVRDILNQS